MMKAPSVLLLMIATITASSGLSGRAGAQLREEIRELAPGQPIEREIAGGETHAYRVTLASGQFLRAVIDQRGVNLLITLFTPEGQKMADLDSPVGTQGPEPVSLLAEAAGSYRLEVRALQKNAPKGRYEIRIEELRAAKPQDKDRINAERAYAEATLAYDGTAESMRKAIEKYEKVIPLWQALGERSQEAHTLTTIGFIHRNLGEYQQALGSYRRALPLHQAAGDRRGEAMTLYQLGAVHDHLGEPQKSLDFYR